MQVEGQAMLLGEALGGRDYHRCGVGQGHEADVEYAFFRCIAGVDPGQSVAAGSLLLAHCVFPIHTERRRTNDCITQKLDRRHCL
ncbi:hypothetical protein D9M68_895700 [compost metagenome]